MEYVDGRSLRDWINCNAKPSVSEVVEIVEQLVTGLRAMHRRETLHGDLKPDNVMVEADGTVRIIDFGSCHVAGVREIDLPFAREVALGTERYSAPEYRLGTRPSNRSDLFSLAMIAYEMLTHGGRPLRRKIRQRPLGARLFGFGLRSRRASQPAGDHVDRRGDQAWRSR